MQCRVLGPLEFSDDEGTVLDLGGRKQRALLGLLVASSGRVVSVDRLVDELWGESPPAKVLASVQSYVANLRRALEPHRASRAPAGVLLTRPPGYALTLPPGGLDAAAFERLAPSAAPLLTRDPERARQRLRDAAALWRGEAYADIAAAAPGLAAEAARLEELRVAAAEDCWQAELALGEQARVVGEIEALVAAQPLRERAWGLLALALYRSQRQGDALEALRRARTVLADQLGVDPGVELRRLELAILTHDPELDSAPAGRAPRAENGAGTGPVGGPPATRLVGRDDVLARLHTTLTAAADGRGSLVLVTGEPGIGKTALAQAVTATAGSMGLRVGWGRCEEDGGAPAMWPWSEALHGALAGLDAARHERRGEFAAAAALLPGLARAGSEAVERQPADVDTTTFRLGQALCSLLRDVIGPCLLVIDDLHWADADTVTLLRRVAPALPALPVVVLATSRKAEAEIGAPLAAALGDLARTDPVRVRLGGLASGDVPAYLRSRHGVALDAEASRVLRDRTDGNPFLLGELGALLAEQGLPADPAAVYGLEVPEGVRDVVRRRLAQLPPDADTLLSVAAVSGRRFDLDVVVAAGGLDRDAGDAAADAAVRFGVLVADEGGGYAFAHDLVREAVYLRVPLAGRRGLHAALAGAIEQLWAVALEDRLAELALHHDRAGGVHARAAWTYFLRAAARSTAQPAPGQAVSHCEAALSALTRDPTATPPDRYGVLVALVRARKRAGQERAAWEAQHEAPAVALAMGDVVAAARAVTIGADSIWSWREYARVDRASVVLMERLLAGLPAGHEVLRARLCATLAAELYYLPAPPERAVALCDEASRLVRAAGDGQEIARVLELRHVALERPHLLADRLATAGELVELAELAAEPVAIARALIFRGKDFLESGQVARGLADYARARALAQDRAVVPLLVALDFADAVMAMARGDFALAERASAGAVAMHATTTLPGAAEIPVGLAVTLNLARGTLDSIEPMLAMAKQDYPAGPFRDLHALALLEGGRVADALAVIGPWDSQPDPPRDYLWLLHMAIRAALWSRLAPPEAAGALRTELMPYADRVAIAGTGISIAGFLGHGVGLLARASGDVDEAITLLAAAWQRNDAAGFRPFAAASARELAMTLRQRGGPGDPATAAGYEDRALAIGTEIGVSFGS